MIATIITFIVGSMFWDWFTEPGWIHKIVYVVGLFFLWMVLLGATDGGGKPTRTAPSTPRPAANPTPTKPRYADCPTTIWTDHIQTIHQHHEWIKPNFFRQTAPYWRESPEGRAGINGTPGVGLNSSDFGNERVGAGQAGERELAQMMLYLGIPSERVQTYWSLRIPGSNWDTDVDAVVSYGDTIYLIDAKQYATREYSTYTMDREDSMVLIDALTNKVIRYSDGREIRHNFSRNMALAMNAYQTYFPNARIEGVVLLCPTKNGIAGTSGNMGICKNFKGVPMLAVTQSWPWLAELKRDIDATNGVTRPDWDKKLKGLLKK